ncbi:MAG: M28 family peptidase, partial [Jiangellaceae bacterium]
MVSRKGRTVIAATAVGGLALATALAGPAQAAPNNNSVDKLTKAVTLEGLLEHADALQAIADANGGTRASGTPGFDASADYVAGLLEDAGYDVTRQPFDFAFFEEFGSSFEQVAPVPTIYVDQTDYDLMDYSGSGDVTAEVVGVDLAIATPASSTSGCEAADFVDVSGKIALMQRGACAFGLKAANAEAAGAVGAVIFNQGNSDPAVDPSRHDLFAGTLGAPVGIPTVSVSFSQGVEFSEAAGLVLHMTADTTSEIRSTENVIADNGQGRTDNTVMAGGHLDSVNAGPGINDNGSGSIALLETALQMAKVKTNNNVRFAWWGAEESGLLGSEHYVANLTEDEAADIALYLN